MGNSPLHFPLALKGEPAGFLAGTEWFTSPHPSFFDILSPHSFSSVSVHRSEHYGCKSTLKPRTPKTLSILTSALAFNMMLDFHSLDLMFSLGVPHLSQHCYRLRRWLSPNPFRQSTLPLLLNSEWVHQHHTWNKRTSQLYRDAMATLQWLSPSSSWPPESSRCI